MNQTRRAFVGTAVATAALARSGLSFAAASPVRMSLADFARDPRKLDSLRRGVAAMKARPPSDHRSWFWWAATHAYNDALYAEALARDARLAKVDANRYWNKCPHFGQCSADFLIWHRAYLYYFERTLRDAAQDADLAIPYWDYSKERGRYFPSSYAPEMLDHGQTNPLYHPNREMAFTSGRFEISPDISASTDTVSAPIFFSDVGVTGFAGDILDSDHTQLGLIEQRPHNDIHIAVGGIVGSNNGAMADIPTAAFDPVFWAHHANIDRMWAVWAATPGKSWGPLPPPSWLDEEPWLFVDFDGSEKRISRRFVMERRNLDVRYDVDDPGKPQLTLPAIVMASGGGAPGRTASSAPVPASVMGEMSSSAREVELAANDTPFDVSPNAAVTRDLGGSSHRLRAAAPSDQSAMSSMIGAPAPTLMAPQAANGQRIVLELSDIRFDRTPSSGFGVYLGTETNAQGTFVGLIDLFGATHRHVSGMSGMTTVQRFDVTRIVRQSRGPFRLRVAPYSLLVSASGVKHSRDDGIHIGGMRFVAIG